MLSNSRSKVYKLYNLINKKTIASKYVEVEEKGIWDWRNGQEENDNIFPVDDDENQVDMISPQLTLPSTLPPRHGQDISSSSSSSNKMPHHFEVFEIFMMILSYLIILRT